MIILFFFFFRTGFKRVPEFAGKEVDLFKLYNLVTDRGGWLKVSNFFRESQVLPEIGLSPDAFHC